MHTASKANGITKPTLAETPQGSNRICVQKRIAFLTLLAFFTSHFVARAAVPERWYARSPGLTTSQLNGVTYGANRFVAVGANGAVVTSPDGVAWIKPATGSDKYFSCVAYGNGMFLAAGCTCATLVSANGTDWTSYNQNFPVFMNGVAFGAGLFVVVGDNGTICSSPDGIL